MNKIQKIILESYGTEYDVKLLDDTQINELVGTLLGIATAKTVAPILGALSTKLIGLGAVKAGTTLLGASKVAGVIGASAGAVVDVVAGSKIAKMIKNHITKDNEFKVKFRNKKTGKIEYRVGKGHSVKDVINNVAKDNNVNPNDVEQVMIHKVHRDLQYKTY